MRSRNHNAIEPVRETIGALRASLLAPSPEALESHLPALEKALHDLQGLQHDSDLQTDLHNDFHKELREDLKALAAELRAAGSLVKHGIEFQQGWARVLAAATDGYRPDGEPRPLQPRGSISVEG